MDEPKSIYYIDKLNYTDIAFMLRDLFLHHFKDTPLTANDEDIDIDQLSTFLELSLINKGLEDFLTTDFGKGMILGMYLEEQMEQAIQDELEAYKEMEGIE